MNWIMAFPSILYIRLGYDYNVHQTEQMASSNDQKTDKYRYHLYDDGEKNTLWRFGGPPNYDVVNKLFEEGRTKIWPVGSMEEKVQNLVKTFEMELFHKTRPQDFKTVDPNKLTLSLNGKKPMTMKQVGEIGGGYNFFLQTTLPGNLRVYDPEHETVETSHVAFTTAFPRGFALEIVEVYSGPPVMLFKFRHWAYMEGPFKGHVPTGEKVEFFGIGIYEVDENMKVVRVEFFFDRGELLGGLIKGCPSDSTAAATSLSCPFLRNTG